MQAFAIEEKLTKVTVPTSEREFDTARLVNVIIGFCEAFTGKTFYPYQLPFARRMIEALLEDIGDDITALFSRQCIPKGTIIHTREGKLMPIEDAPSSWLTRKDANLYEIRGKGGFVLRCTENHPIMTDTGWKRADEISLNDKLVVLDSWDKFGYGIIEADIVFRGKTIHTRYEITDELAELVGWLIADGYIAPARGQSIKFTNTDKTYLDRVEYLVNKCFPDVTVRRYAKGNGYDLLLTKKDGDNPLRHFFNSLKFVERFPTAVNNFTRSQVISMLSAMFAADGYVNVKSEKNIDIGLSCKSFMYAQYCRELLNKLGLRGQIKQEILKKNKTGVPFYRIVIAGQCNVIKFRELIDIPGKPIPAYEFGYTRQNHVEVFTDGIDGEILRYSRVVAINSNAGSSDVYDITVPDKGWFICSGVKVHNSGKSFACAAVTAPCMVILPFLANMPYFQYDRRLKKFKDGLWVGIFAPSKMQAGLMFLKIKDDILESDAAKLILQDPDFRGIQTTVSNGTTVSLNNGSYVKSVSASENAHIEGETFKLLILDESQDISNYVINKSIFPMRSHHHGAIIKIGTTNRVRGNFYDAIQRNKKKFNETGGAVMNHFEADATIVSKYNEDYRKTVEEAKVSMGESSDEFQMSYMLKWPLSRGMFVNMQKFEKDCGEPYGFRHSSDLVNAHVVGVDVAKQRDGFIVTPVEVDWDNPVVREVKFDKRSGEEVSYFAYNSIIKDWKVIEGDDYEDIFYELLDYLSLWKVVKLVIDATREAAFADRVAASCSFEVEPFIFTTPSKSELYKIFDGEIKSGRAKFPNNPEVRNDYEYTQYMEDMSSLTRTYKGQHLVVEPYDYKLHDDYADSHALAIWGAMHNEDNAVGEISQVSDAHLYKSRWSPERGNRILPYNSLITGVNRYTAKRR